MKKTFFLLIFLIINTNLTFAETNIEIGLNQSEITIEDIFVLNIRLTTDEILENQISIEGIEGFKKIGEQVGNQVSLINGKQSVTQVFHLSLYPTQTGSFVIGPAVIKVGEQEVRSETVSLMVRDVMNPKTNSQNDDKIDTFHGVVSSKFHLFDLKYYLVFFILIGGMLFYIFKKYFFKKIGGSNETPPISMEDQKNKIIGDLEKLSQESENFGRSEFYHTLNVIFRKYFGYLTKLPVEHLTYNELKKLCLEDELLVLFEKSYFLEFNNTHEVQDDRISIVNQFLVQINK